MGELSLEFATVGHVGRGRTSHLIVGVLRWSLERLVTWEERENKSPDRGSGDGPCVESVGCMTGNGHDSRGHVHGAAKLNACPPTVHGCGVLNCPYNSMNTALYILLTTVWSCTARRLVIQAVALSAIGLGKLCPTPSNKTSSRTISKSLCAPTTCLRTLRKGSLEA